MNKNDFRYTPVSEAINACKPQQRIHYKLAIGVMALGFALSVSAPLQADTFNVTNTNDSGPGSLRQAILDAEANPGKDTINMSSVSGDISPLTGLPTMYESVDIVGPGAEILNIDSPLSFEGSYDPAIGDVQVNMRDISIAGRILCISNNYSNNCRIGAANSVIGGVSARDDITITDSKIIANDKFPFHTGVAGRAVIRNSSISGFQTGVSAFSGKYDSSSPVILHNSVITGNATAGNIQNGSISIYDTNVKNNGKGFIGTGSFRISNSEVADNAGPAITTNGYGAGYYYTSKNSRIFIESSIIKNNLDGGIITRSYNGYNHGFYLSAFNSTISHNAGPGVSSRSGLVFLNNSTITNNLGGVINAGSYLIPPGYYAPDGVNLIIKNTIISGNSQGGNADLSAEDVPFEISHSLIGNPGTAQINDLVPGSNLIGVDPKLGSLADNGGPTQTHALLAGSPAIDTGDDASCLATDQRGVTRPQGASCDMGAYEVEDVVVPTVAICDLPPVSIGGNCANEVVARSIADIDAYVASNFGRHTLANGKKAFKNLRLIGSIGQTGVPLEVESPCSIQVNTNASLTGSDVTLHARQGLSVNWSADIDAAGEACLIADKQHALLNGGNVVSANALAIRGGKKAIVGFQANLNVNGVAELLSTGTGGNSNAKIGNKTTVTAESFTMKADNIAELAFKANVSTTGALSISSGMHATSETLLTNRSSVQAGADLTLNSQGKTTIGFHTTVTAGNQLDVNAATEADCSVASITSVTYSSKSGNCSDKLP